MTLKEHSVRLLVDQIRQDSNQSSQSAEILVSNWSNLQKKVDTKVTFYNDLFRLHEELKGTRRAFRRRRERSSRVDLLQRENIWLDQLQTKIYATVSNGADAEEISEELDVWINCTSSCIQSLLLLFVGSGTFAEDALEARL